MDSFESGNTTVIVTDRETYEQAVAIFEKLGIGTTTRGSDGDG